jgi:glyoxylase-like metal-dependent hydrolase (beta-lactamase superfamily II)
MLAYMEEKDLTPEAIVLTHAHGDHIAGVDDVRARHIDLPVYLAREEWGMLSDPRQNLSAHFGAGVTAGVTDPRDLAHGDRLELDGVTWDVLDTSGHSPGGRTLYCRTLGVAIVGDAIFAGSVGRVDFPHSDGQRLLRNLHAHVLTLPDETTLIPGHGPSTTVAEERAGNPYLRK